MRNKIILIAIGIAVVAGIVGFWYYQKNIYSKEILKLEILGPDQAELGQEIEYTVKYKNNGNIRLEEPSLVFEYPKYSLLQEGEALRKEIILEDIYPGQEQTFNFKARLLGREGELKKARAWLNYQPKNLKARYESETSHTTQITSVPLTLEFDLPSKIDSGKEVNFKLNYFSNADYHVPQIVNLGYIYQPEFEDRMPERRFFKKIINNKATHHIHMVEIKSEFWQRHLLFRNYLRANPEIAKEYGILKKELSKRDWKNSNNFAEAKSEFIRKVEKQALIDKEMISKQKQKKG